MVSPPFAAAGAGDRERLDPGEIDAEFLEGGDHLGERAGLVGEADHEGGLVAAGAVLGAFADDGEAGDVMGLIFDVLREDVEAIGAGGGTAGDGGGELFALGELGGGGRGDDLDLRRLRERSWSASCGIAKAPATSNRRAGPGSIRSGRGGSGERAAALRPGSSSSGA